MIFNIDNASGMVKGAAERASKASEADRPKVIAEESKRIAKVRAKDKAKDLMLQVGITAALSFAACQVAAPATFMGAVSAGIIGGVLAQIAMTAHSLFWRLNIVGSMLTDMHGNRGGGSGDLLNAMMQGKGHVVELKGQQAREFMAKMQAMGMAKQDDDDDAPIVPMNEGKRDKTVH